MCSQTPLGPAQCWLPSVLVVAVLAASIPGAAGAWQVAKAAEGSAAVARCPAGQIIVSIYKPAYGNLAKNCNFTSSYRVVTSLCLRRASCSVPAVDSRFGVDHCKSAPKTLSFYYSCRILTRPPPPRPKPRPPPRPKPRPRPSPAPFAWVNMTAVQKRRAEELLCIFENSETQPQYGYAENLQDGRGITFGRSGFCTGTGDGVLVVRYYTQLRPSGNPLAKYLPALERIDSQGGGSSTQGLEGFIQAVKAAAADPLFRQAQDRYADKLYWQPSQDMAKQLGVRLALTKAQLYDAYIQHGYSDPGYDVYPISANGMADWVNKQLGGSPLQGVDEAVWLQKYLERRRWVLSNTDSTWAASVARVQVYSWIKQLGGYLLDRAMQLRWDTCRPDRTRGPCRPQQSASELSMGGVIYGDFQVA